MFDKPTFRIFPAIFLPILIRPLADYSQTPVVMLSTGIRNLIFVPCSSHCFLSKSYFLLHYYYTAYTKQTNFKT